MEVRIVATGSYLPETHIRNEWFLDKTFYNPNGEPLQKENQAIVEKVKEITGIVNRPYVKNSQNASELGYLAAKAALDSSGIDGETLDYIIVAHNFADVPAQGAASDLLPNLGARIKNKLGIKNSHCVTFDILFGCPGWLQAIIQANCFLKSGMAKRIMVIGTDVLSRVSDPHDIDSMLFSDGAGATILEAVPGDGSRGILGFKAVSDCGEEVDYLTTGRSYHPEAAEHLIYIKMQGKKVFKYAMETVPVLITECLQECGIPLTQVNSILMHQANEKMIQAMASKLFDINKVPNDHQIRLPLTVQEMGNNSVATIPVMMDLILKGKLPGESIVEGDTIVFASVGAGMHANVAVYRH